MFQEKLKNGWKLYGKTGNGTRLDINGEKISGQQLGWFVGFVEKNRQKVAFVYLLEDGSQKDSYASVRAKDLAKDKINTLLKNIS